VCGKGGGRGSPFLKKRNDGVLRILKLLKSDLQLMLALPRSLRNTALS